MSPHEESQTRLRRLQRDLTADRQALVARAAEIARVSVEDEDSARAAVLAVALHHYYTAFESAIERAVRALDGDVPSGPDWHRALLTEAAQPLPGVRPTIISATSREDWAELLRFRHFFRHAYAVSLDWDKLRVLAGRVAAVHPHARADLEALLDRLGDAIDELDGGEV